MKKYSAGIAAKGFWFLEFKKYLQLENMGKTKKEIREIQASENIFCSNTERTGLRILGETASRSKILDKELKDMFFDLDSQNQRIINLIAIMKSDRLFFEFIYHAYKEELMIGTEIFDLKIIRKFLSNKRAQDDDVANFTDGTIKRLCGAYSTYLKEAGLIDNVSGIMKIKRVVLDYRLEQILKKEKFSLIYKAIKGVV